jgi:hypothetical protein
MNLKRGAKVFLACGDRPPSGPFKWTLVREWVALELVATDARVKPEDSTEWFPVSAVETLTLLPASMLSPGSSIMYYRSSNRTDCPSAPRQHSYLRALGCPFETSLLDEYLAWRVISQMEETFPERAVPSERVAAEKDLLRQHREGPATARQREYLKSIGEHVPKNLSLAEASRMISGPPSEGQLRRLRFYQIPLPHDLTKDGASYLIDDYMRQHPESEARYQAWKQIQSDRDKEPSAEAPTSFSTPEIREKAAAALKSLESVSPPHPSSPPPPPKKSWWKLW